MTVYFKATRPDGTDFWTGRILYEPGRTVLLEPVDGERRLCGPGYLHAADVPAETLVGGSWPCRLFEVSGTPRAGFDAWHPHKGGFKQLKVLRELPAWQALGPNGVEVAALIDRAGRLTAQEAKALLAARVAARGAAWVAALVAALLAARVAAWVAAWDAAGDAAGDAARAAALALVVRDLITPDQFDALYGPWRTVIGDPA